MLENNSQFIAEPLQPIRLKKTWYKRLLIYIGMLMIVVVGYVVFYFGLLYTTITVENGPFWKSLAQAVVGIDPKQIPEEELDPNPMPTPTADRLSILVLGIRGDDAFAIAQEGGLLTDTLLLVTVDKKQNKATMISIPRDVYLSMPTYLKDGTKIYFRGKVNEVYERGLAHKQGLSYVSSVVSKITGVYVDKAVMFNFDAFREIVDNLGGIEIKLSKPFVEATQWGYEFSLPAGQNQLNGEQALYYARSRYSSSDFDRARRQQEVILAIKNKALNLGFLANPIKVNSLFSDIKDDIRTNVQLWEIGDFINIAKRISGNGAIARLVLTSDNVLYESKTDVGAFILLPKSESFDSLRSTIANLLSGGTAK